jgi:alpha-tubulin suppressor-like RCC1 family protein
MKLGLLLAGSLGVAAVIGGYGGDPSGGARGRGAVASDADGSASASSASAAGGVIQLASGHNHSCVLLAGGRVRCWGSNADGQLGNGTTHRSMEPVAVMGLPDGVVAIAAGDAHTCAVLSSGAVQCWGNNSYGQLGGGSGISSLLPVRVAGLEGVTAIQAGLRFTCALLADQSVRCWGNNDYGQLGNASTTSSSFPVAVAGLGGVTALTHFHGSHVCALLADKSARCWGFNGRGQLGDGSTANSSTPVAVQGMSNVAALSAGGGTTYALLDDGSVWSWGDNQRGELGDGSAVGHSATPVRVAGLSNVVRVSAGASHACARLSDGSVACWGGGAAPAPAPVAGVAGATFIAAGRDRTCALLADGMVNCWGERSPAPVAIAF